ncbi:MAG: hypothetical protein KM310_00820 [Clostridiales bacterium]|nr:hypothetical protein [Clostridiales bacterium]
MRYLESIWEAYEHREKLVQSVLERRNNIKKAVLPLREEVNIRRVRPGQEYKRYVAVDSAYLLDSYGYTAEYLAAAVAVWKYSPRQRNSSEPI